ncbi:MAG: hypothetical protein RSD76_01620 [Clostridia bacterium]
MRINEYSSLEELTSQYVGEWSPSDGHWFGLEFRYHDNEYRLHTWTMHADDPEYLEDGREVMFGLYAIHRKPVGNDEFYRIASFATMEDLLKSTCIGERAFSEVIMDDATEILAQD